jgi:hypothetical protein
MQVELNQKEAGLIRDCLIVVSKSQGVGVDQMKELLNLVDKFVEEKEE